MFIIMMLYYYCWYFTRCSTSIFIYCAQYVRPRFYYDITAENKIKKKAKHTYLYIYIFRYEGVAGLVRPVRFGGPASRDRSRKHIIIILFRWQLAFARAVIVQYTYICVYYTLCVHYNIYTHPVRRLARGLNETEVQVREIGIIISSSSLLLLWYPLTRESGGTPIDYRWTPWRWSTRTNPSKK